jgi:hypothetical protein
MNDEELVNDCLRKYDTDEDALNSIRCHGVDESVLQALREFGTGEEIGNALRDYRHRKYAADEALEKARQRKAVSDSIESSPVLKDLAFWECFRREEAAKEESEKNKERVKRYIDNAGQPATGPKSRMGVPRRGADGRVIWDEGISSGQFDPASAHLRKAEQGSLQNCGQCANYNQDKTCQIVTGPVSADLTCDKFMAIPAKPVSLVYGAASRDSVQRKNVTADGKIDPNISIMGTPKRNPDGSITWK